MARFVALLRGINVGGNNIIKMTDLKACFESDGFEDVTTFIQSGNVLFTAKGSRGAPLTKRVEAMLEKRFGYRATVVIRSDREMSAVIEEAPKGFGKSSARRYDVIFLMPPVTAAKALAVLPRNPDVDDVSAGPGVVYYSRLASKATQSRLSKVVSLPIYKSVTIRNWNTTTKLHALLDAQ